MKIKLAAIVFPLASAALAQGFTTAAEVKPILQATKANWVALRDYDGNDLLYFTHLESWRCGLAQVRFSVNSTAATRVWEMEPCYEGTAQPNALKLKDHLPYIVIPQGMTNTVSVVVVYDDGTEDRADFERKAILMP
jgi:L-aminopeptidase/D-esterase-like protein